MATHGSTTWKVALEADLRWRTWEDQFVVYNVASGDTHLLNLIAGEALEYLSGQGADLEGLVGHLSATLDIDPDAQFTEKIQELLDHLNELGLIEPVAP